MTDNLAAGRRVKAVDFTRAVFNYSQTSIANISTTTYAVGDPEMAVRFMAPTSGRVGVMLSAGIRNNSTANEDRVFVSFRILEGDPQDGNLIQTEDAKNGRSNPAQGVDSYQYGGQMTMVDGLTPGVWYFAQIRHRVTGSATADIAYRGIMVIPVP